MITRRNWERGPIFADASFMRCSSTDRSGSRRFPDARPSTPLPIHKHDEADMDHSSASERGIDLKGYPHPSFQFSSGIGGDTCSRSARIADWGWTTPAAHRAR